MTGVRFAAAMQALTRQLPFGLSRLVPPTLIGYLLINGGTFAFDLVLLDVLHGRVGWPLPAAVTLAYGSALTASFVLNRVLNFRSRAPVGRQVTRYVVVVLVNYTLCVLGVSTGLTALGVDYRLARIIAGLCEAALLYVAMRTVVFRPTYDSIRGNDISASSR